MFFQERRWSALLMYLNNWNGKAQGLPHPCLRVAVEWLAGVCEFFQGTAAIFSYWVIIAFSAERFLAIKYPLRHRIRDSLRQSRKAICAILLSAMLFSLYQLINYYLFYYYRFYANVDPLDQRIAALSHGSAIHTWINIGIALRIFFFLVLNIALLREILRIKSINRMYTHAVDASYSNYENFTSCAQQSSQPLCCKLGEECLYLFGSRRPAISHHTVAPRPSQRLPCASKVLCTRVSYDVATLRRFRLQFPPQPQSPVNVYCTALLTKHSAGMSAVCVLLYGGRFAVC
ncbi:uncharacterized protein LOC129601493 isoform X2 [Paramacrobiotus metropolitanus]|uniref:uncharacterized protein LOC129601493 isoform X2 n=1 Tax=Paramacrobiotus metropolitanus TaxID=2943436 RepID=UPI00244639DE|nr:uncharacterized protein LOC129601493 isoform X2 [Paramacrobiotus metropolitanus]